MNYDRTNMREDEWEADGVLYTAVETPSAAFSCEGCVADYSMDLCLELPACEAWRRIDGQSVIWLKAERPKSSEDSMDVDHAQTLLDMAEQLERPFWTGPTGADAALVEQAKVLRAAAAHLQRETEARKAAQQELAELREKYQALGVRAKRAEQDSKRLDWLADKSNTIGNVTLPTECVERNPHSLRAAIDDAMNHFEGVRGMVEPEQEIDND